MKIENLVNRSPHLGLQETWLKLVYLVSKLIVLIGVMPGRNHVARKPVPELSQHHSSFLSVGSYRILPSEFSNKINF